MKKATLDKLEALHGAVADILADGLEACDPKLVEDDDGGSHLEGYDARLVGQALSFLKDNDITVDHDTGDAVDAAQAALDQIRKKKRVDNDPFADIPHH
jgi:hypothetical protein